MLFGAMLDEANNGIECHNGVLLATSFIFLRDLSSLDC
jgi:hypothetical protein